MTNTLVQLYRKEWSGGWILAKYLFVSSLLLTLLPKYFFIGDSYGATDMVFVKGPYRLNSYILFTPFHAYICFYIALIGLILSFFNNKIFYLGIFLYLISNSILLSSEALNVKAYDRLSLWLILTLVLAPKCCKNIKDFYASPFSRYLVIIIYSALYGMTGLLKLIREPAWFNGTALSSHLSHQFLGSTEIGLFLAQFPLLMLLFGILTLLFELSFPFLIWIKEINPYLLAVGFFMHLAIFLTMNVNTFSFIALSFYPVLLHPECALILCEKFKKSYLD